MLYDPKWEITVTPITKPDIYALPTLIAWLETMPESGEYDYFNCKGACLLDLYRAAHGLGPSTSSEYYDLCRSGWGRNIAAGTPRTFGAALTRARKLATHAEHAGKS